MTSLTDLDLAPLGNYGGPTQTMALLAGSPAIGAGVIADYPGTTTPITTDQRGLPLDSPNPDIGAFQTQGSTLTALTFSGISDQSITYGTPSVTISGTLANGSQAPVGETVAVTLDGVEQSATIGSGGAFSTTFDTTGLTVANSPYTISLRVYQRRDLRLRQYHQHADGHPGDAHHLHRQQLGGCGDRFRRLGRPAVLHQPGQHR